VNDELERKMIAFWDIMPSSLVGLLQQDYASQYPRRLSSSYALPREPEISRIGKDLEGRGHGLI
jgi:hypothetical protein